MQPALSDVRERVYPAFEPPVPELGERHFIHFDEAWYADANRPLVGGAVDEVSFGEKGHSLHVRWYQVNNSACPKLEVFDDGWRELAAMPDVVALLGRLDDRCATPADLCAELKKLGFRDATPREQ